MEKSAKLAIKEQKALEKKNEAEQKEKEKKAKKAKMLSNEAKNTNAHALQATKPFAKRKAQSKSDLGVNAQEDGFIVNPPAKMQAAGEVSSSDLDTEPTLTHSDTDLF